MTDRERIQLRLIGNGYTPRIDLSGWTDEDRAVLHKYGAWFEALGNGEVEPSTEAQRHFAQVAYGLAAPTTKYEAIWRRYLVARKQESVLGQGAFVDEAASRRISQLNVELRNLRLENEALRRKVDVLETQLANCHKTLAKYETPPETLVIDHVEEMRKHPPTRQTAQVVFAATDGQD